MEERYCQYCGLSEATLHTFRPERIFCVRDRAEDDRRPSLDHYACSRDHHGKLLFPDATVFLEVLEQRVATRIGETMRGIVLLQRPRRVVHVHWRTIEDRYCWCCGGHQARVTPDRMCDRCGARQFLIGGDTRARSTEGERPDTVSDDAEMMRLLPPLARAALESDPPQELHLEVSAVAEWFVFWKSVNGIIREARVAVAVGNVSASTPTVRYLTVWSEDGDKDRCGSFVGEVDFTVGAIARFLVQREDLDRWCGWVRETSRVDA